MVTIKVSKFIIVTVAGLFLLSGCTDGFRGYFKKSANNKWFDSKGFQGGKRKPLYNKKYINLAKKNILEENFDDDEIDDDSTIEGSNISSINRQIYVDMIKQDAKRKERLRLKQLKAASRKKRPDNGDYPDIGDAQIKINKAQNDEQNLQQELTEIKSMLIEAKKDLTKYRCPMENSSESVKQSRKEVGSSPSKLKAKFIKEQEVE
ncbi:MAG: hypothetical protein ACRYE9_05450 [Janthinobacterium lividum]